MPARSGTIAGPNAAQGFLLPNKPAGQANRMSMANPGRQTSAQMAFNQTVGETEYRPSLTEENQQQFNESENSFNAGDSGRRRRPAGTNSAVNRFSMQSETTSGRKHTPGSVTLQSASSYCPTESNFVTIGGNGSLGKDNGLVSQEKSPYAVALHNVDKFEQLTEVKARKSKTNDER